MSEGQVQAVSDPDENIAGKFASQLNSKCYTDWQKMLDEVKPDFVFAFAPHNLMKDMALNLIARKIPFAIEKPMGLNAEEAAEEAKAFCAIPFVWRYSDTVAKLKESILKTKIIHMQYRFIAGPPSRYLASSKWMLSSATAGGGCMTNLGVHFIDMALYLTGSKSADVLSSVYQYGHDYDIVYYPKFAQATLDDFINGRKPRASATEMLVVRKILDRMNEAAKY